MKRNVANIPPVIRVFLSSTFADMEKERSYFNEVISPKISRLCAERGVSFFSVDLRWGITEEDQVNGKVLPICLSEIDKCRPYFIGMIGNRYGSILQTVPHSICASIPWLEGKEGHSITELEMLYAVLEHDGREASNCAFYLRSDRLSEEIYSGLSGEKDSSVQRLQRLKDRILRDERIPSSHYDSIEEFGNRVLQDLTQWLNIHFPETGDVSRIRREWYDGELLRNHIPNVEANRFLDLYLSESNRPLMLYGDGARGKTAFLTAWQPQDGHKITVNCGADDAFSYWPSIAREIVNEIQGMDKNYGMPNINFGASFYFKLMDAVHREKAEPKRGAQKDLFFVTDEEREQFRTEFVKWMRDLKPHTPIVIVINDLNLLEDAQSKLLSWLPSTLPNNLHIICSTNDNDMIKTVELLEWNVKEMPLFLQACAGKYITEYLHSYGKSLSSGQFESLLASGVCRYPGQLRFVLSFLINQGRFQNLDQLISRIAEVKEIRELYFVAYDFLLEEYSAREKEAIRQVFALVYCSELSLNEQECFDLVQETVSVNPIEWAHIYRIFEQFGIIKGDYWNIRNQETRRFAEQLLTGEERKLAHRILADHFTSLLHTDEENRRNLQAIRSKTMYAKAVLMHREKSNDWEALLAALQDREVLYFLSKLDWQWVCKGWMELFLHSDLDLPTVLMEMIREYAACEGEEKGIAMELAALMVDLGYQSARSQVSMILGTDMVAGKRTLAFSRNMSPDFVETYQKMQKLRREGQYRQLYAYVTEVLDKGVYPDLELCQILFFKTDIQSKLGLYHDAIQTANEYYRVAIKSGIFDEMFRALHMRGDGLFRLREFRDAREVMEKVTEISLSEGRLRDYLASRNVTAMCLYHTKDYDGAIAVFDQLFAYWEKLSDIREAATVYLNRGNALSLSGRNTEAMQTLKEYSEKLRGKPALESHYARFLGNIGVFALNLKEYAIAEEHLQEGIALCKKIGQEASLVLAYNTLFEVYKQSDRPLKAVEIGREQMELLWNRRGYAQIIEILKAVVELLLMGKYYAMAKSLEEEWKQRYSSIPGGAEYFEKQIGPGMVDAVKADALKEQIIVARGEGDKAKEAELYVKLAEFYDLSEYKTVCEYLLQAAKLFAACENRNSSRECIEVALAFLFEKGKIKNEALCSEILQFAQNEQLCEVVRLWEAFGEDSGRNREASDPDKPETHTAMHLDKLLSFIPEQESLVAKCLKDISLQIVESCGEALLICAVESFSEKIREDAYRSICTAMEKNFQEDISKLMVDFLSPAATAKIEFYEKCFRFMNHFDNENLAAIAGNLALIFRRRNDKEKTVYYHEISGEKYKARGKTKDYLIETMNVATAYSAFGDMEKAIELLRTGMQEAGTAGEDLLQASMAGNLASMLSKRNLEHERQELLYCFSVEEAYFRSTENIRDLVISLLNQILYYRKAYTIKEWKPKLEEAGSLIRKYNLKEFVSVLSRLEWEAAAMSKEQQHSEEADVEKKLSDLLQDNESYVVEATEFQDGVYHCVCRPKDKVAMGAEELHLFYQPEEFCHLNVIGLFRPFMYAEQKAPEVKGYIDWWNKEAGEYSLALDEEKHVLRGNGTLSAANWQTLRERLDTFLKLWSTDKINTVSLLLGLVDLPACQGVKLKALNGSI